MKKPIAIVIVVPALLAMSAAGAKDRGTPTLDVQNFENAMRFMDAWAKARPSPPEVTIQPEPARETASVPRTQLMPSASTAGTKRAGTASARPAETEPDQESQDAALLAAIKWLLRFVPSLKPAAVAAWLRAPEVCLRFELAKRSFTLCSEPITTSG